MPFKIVQTSENNRNRLFTVPSAWESKNILKWPRKHVTKYIKDEFSTPEVDWKQLRCMVKRQDIPSYETAEYVLGEMLQHTDTEDDTNSSSYKISGKTVQELNLNIIADEIVYPANMTAVTESSEITTDTCTIPAAPLTGLDNDGVYQFHIVSDNQNNTNQHQCCANLEQSLAIQNVLLSNQTQILEQLNTITKVQNSIVQKVALFSVQLDDAVLQMNQMKDKDFIVTELSEIGSTTANTGLYVKPVDSIQKLNELEQQLSENSGRQQLKNRYSVICSGGRGIDCAYTLVDILFSRDLLCQCTWSGGSRKDDVKIAFKSYKNILSFFWGMIHSWDVTYTIKDNDIFFKNILKNSKKRQMAKNQRASTSRKRVKLSKVQIVNEEDTSDEDMSNDSEKNYTDNKENPISEELQYTETKYEKKDDENKPNDFSKRKENYTEKENKDIIEETKGDQAINERRELSINSSPNRNENNPAEECAVKEIEKELNSLEEITGDKKEQNNLEFTKKTIEETTNEEKKQNNLEFTRNSKEETITEENKENMQKKYKEEVPKNTDENNEPSTSSKSNFKKDTNKPKTKIVKIIKKKKENKCLEKFKKIRRIHNNVSR